MLPLVLILLPDHPGGEILVKKVLTVLPLRVGLEPSSECGVLISV
jgi:hypothetical protein